MERRKFLKYATTSLALPFLFQGQWITAMANDEVFNSFTLYNPQRKLILIQLDGGNDGLNMVIPTSQYDNLARARLNLLVQQSKILKLTEETGLHPSMTELQNLYNNGKLMIVQGVGYPNPNLSHFRSKDIMLSASDSNTEINSGWVGRLLDKQYPSYPAGYPNVNQPHPIALTIGSTSSPTCQGNTANFSSVITNLSLSYTNSSPTGGYPATPFGDELKYVTSIMEQTESYLSVIKTAAASATNLSSLYPAAGQNSLADQLKMVARLIAGGLQTQIYVVSLGGWDTHSGQVANDADKLTGTHPTLMSKVSKAIAAFQDDLKLLGKADDTLGFVYTEFGRRIKSNDSIGTDHGTSWPALIFGSKVNPGIVGQNPVIPAVVSKSDNLAMQYDFRSIYAGIFRQWFALTGSETAEILGRNFPEIKITAEITGIDPVAGKPAKTLKIWPNPVNDFARLSFEAVGGVAHVMIYSMNGKLVENHMQRAFSKGSQQIEIQLGHLRRGSYQLVLQQRNNRESTTLILR